MEFVSSPCQDYKPPETASEQNVLIWVSPKTCKAVEAVFRTEFLEGNQVSIFIEVQCSNISLTSGKVSVPGPSNKEFISLEIYLKTNPGSDLLLQNIGCLEGCDTVSPVVDVDCLDITFPFNEPYSNNFLRLAIEGDCYCVRVFASEIPEVVNMLRTEIPGINDAKIVFSSQP